ncbi:hypothetical protein FACS1894158_17210 [Betaproteobacteria bacterium]|nr:hypothetical protein FACS1894158_17210 [Betaproteobacteria bacterium]
MRFQGFFAKSFIMFFMAMLILPLVFVDLSPNRKSEQENRMLAERPPLRDLKAHSIFIRRFDAWFKDSTGFRESALALYRALDNFKWEGQQYTNGDLGYLVGRQGHRYFTGFPKELILKFQGKPLFSDDQLRNLAKKLDEVKGYLATKGIPFMVMFCTDKESIYPEYYPKSIRRGPEPIQLDVLTKYLQDHTGVDVFNIRQALLAEKEKYPLYPKASGDLTHYNEIGSFFAYQELMRHIQPYFPDFVSYGMEDVTIRHDDDGTATVSLKQAAAYKELAQDFFDDITVARPFTTENQAFENNNADLPTILILCDSYVTHTSFLTKYIAQQFGKTIAIHYRNLDHFEEYITKYDPDIVLFETSERQLGWLVASVMGIKL